MARPLLIALLTVAAVAWPVTALGPIPDSPVPLVDPQVLDPSVSLAAASCRVAHLDTEPEGPNFSVQTDPDGCLRELIDKVWPLTEGSATNDGSADSETDAPSPEAGDPDAYDGQPPA